MDIVKKTRKILTQPHIEQPLLGDVKLLTGVGIHLADLLANLQIYTILDLLLHLPYKYQDRTRITPINYLQPSTHAVFEGKVVDIKFSFSRAKKRNLSLYLNDATGMIELKFFQFNANQLAQFKTHPVLRCFGEIKYGQRSLQVIHPEYEIVNEQFIHPVEANLRPIYPSTEGISQRKWQALLDSALRYLERQIGELDHLPAAMVRNNNLMDFKTAIKFIHRPPPDISLNILEDRNHPAQQRLIFEELLAQSLAMQLIKNKQQKHQGLQCSNESLANKLLELIPFKLTAAQIRVAKEIAKDLNSTTPMNRLLQGDVGSGKTIIAAMAILQAVASGYQVALMAPTEILAEQHYNNLKKYFEIIGVESALLVAKINKKLKQSIKQELSDNKIAIVIGTQALIQDDVLFKSLGLIIIDEQHRFGVEQRHLLLQKGVQQQMVPHQLTMTATPIPRTLAMTIYSHMDYSVIDELPPGRKAITTVVIADQKRDMVIDRIKAICQQGRQVYWVCTLIEESEVLTCQAAVDSYVLLQQQLSSISVGLIHGRMKADEKSVMMQDFKNGKIKVLVATTVIEVGVDVPNASLMVIENPERLGLSQLHQLRGRVGRGEYESYCVLLYQSPLSESAEARLKAMRETQDGFKLAEYDLKLRGSGELLGKKQTGIWNLKIADLIKDRSMLKDVRKMADYLHQHHPELILPLIKLWLGNNYNLGLV